VACQNRARISQRRPLVLHGGNHLDRPSTSWMWTQHKWRNWFAETDDLTVVASRRLPSNEQVEMAVRERLRIHIPEFYSDSVLKFVLRRGQKKRKIFRRMW
jgi:hypothetical protein